MSDRSTTVLSFLFLLIISTNILQSFTDSSQLIQLTDCVCSGRRQTYQCTVCGPGATVWTGTLFECDNQNLITLRHREFENGSSSGECNNRALIASSIGTSLDSNCSRECFVSELSFIAESDFSNKTIKCLHNNGTVENLVDETTVHVITDPLPPPDNVRLIDIGPTALTLSWIGSSTNCNSTAIKYIVSSNGSEGVCPNTTETMLTNATLIFTKNIIPIIGKQCNFSVQTEVCVNIAGEKSDALMVTFTVPGPPVLISNNSYYDQGSQTLHIAFNKPETYYISTGFDGSATNYTVTYSDTVSNTSCSMDAVVPAHTCVDGVCSSQLNLSDGDCSDSDNVTVVVYATNKLGNGPKSEPIVMKIDKGTAVTQSEQEFTAVIIIGVLIFVVVLSVTVIIIIAVIKIRKRNTPDSQRTFEQSTMANETSGSTNLHDIVPKMGQLYADIGPFTKVATTHNLFLDDERIEYAEIRQSSEVIQCSDKEIHTQSIDKSLNLDVLLVLIGPQVTPKWYELGEVVGISKEFLDKCRSYPSKECIIEVLDHWLRNKRPTWKDVAEALRALGLEDLSERMLSVYETGKLPIEVDMNAFSDEQEAMLQSSRFSEELPPPIPPKNY